MQCNSVHWTSDTASKGCRYHWWMFFSYYLDSAWRRPISLKLFLPRGRHAGWIRMLIFADNQPIYNLSSSLLHKWALSLSCLYVCHSHYEVRFKYTTKFSLPKIACPAIVYAISVVFIGPFFVCISSWIKVYRYKPTKIWQRRLQGVRNVAQKLCSCERSCSQWDACREVREYLHLVSVLCDHNMRSIGVCHDSHVFHEITELIFMLFMAELRGTIYRPKSDYQ